MEDQYMAANTEEISEGIATPEVTVESEQTQATTEHTEDVTTTKAFSERLNAMTQKAVSQERERQDNFARKYGYSSFEEMERVQAEAEAEEEREQFRQQNGFDPDSVKPLFEQWKESDPDFAELKAIKADKAATTALNDLNAQLKDVGMDLQIADTSDAELNKLPNIDQITQLVTKGHSLADAFFLANKKDIIASQTAKAQQETIKKINANGESSPGSLAGGGEAHSNSVHSMSKADFVRLQEEVLRGERKSL